MCDHRNLLNDKEIDQDTVPVTGRSGNRNQRGQNTLLIYEVGNFTSPIVGNFTSAPTDVEQVVAQHFLPVRPVEPLELGVLVRLPGLDVTDLHIVLVAAFDELAADQLGTVVTTDRLGQAAPGFVDFPWFRRHFSACC
jgi:hypothetical protein